MKLLQKKIIYGCDSRGDGNSPYLTRITLIETRYGAAYIHKFHRSDAPEHHDHPWPFASMILWRGYLEETPCPDCKESGMVKRSIRFADGYDLVPCEACEGLGFQRNRTWPGMLLFRRAVHRHRVVLVDEKRAVTLVIRGPYVRDWGFFTSTGWQGWREYFKERGC